MAAHPPYREHPRLPATVGVASSLRLQSCRNARARIAAPHLPELRQDRGACPSREDLWPEGPAGTASEAAGSAAPWAALPRGPCTAIPRPRQLREAPAGAINSA